MDDDDVVVVVVVVDVDIGDNGLSVLAWVEPIVQVKFQI